MAATLETVNTVKALRDTVAEWFAKGETVALVPTMGALHEGHLSLVKIANAKADRTLVSIFVNPTQFAPSEDFSSYPRDTEGDDNKLHSLGVDLVYAPKDADMYPKDFSTRVDVGELAEGLCAASRPHFFGGVATVVTKLLLQCLPDYAIFGEKDYQQLLVIKRLVRDLDIPVEIVSGPIVREADGLAMSSRNAYLSHHDRVIAPLLYRTLVDVADDLAEGRPVEDALAAGRMRLEIDGFQLDYIEARNAETLRPVDSRVKEPARIFAAVLLSQTRLIDNVPVGQE